MRTATTPQHRWQATAPPRPPRRSFLARMVGARSGSHRARPTYSTSSGPNGQPYLEFDGMNTFLEQASSLGWSEGQIWVVVKATSDPSTTGGGLWRFNNDSNTHYNYYSGLIYECWGVTARENAITPPAALTSWHVYSVSSSASGQILYRDGTAFNTSGAKTTSFNVAPQIGRNVSGGIFQGKIAGWIATDTVLSSTDRAKVDNYLRATYGTP